MAQHKTKAGLGAYCVCCKCPDNLQKQTQLEIVTEHRGRQENPEYFQFMESMTYVRRVSMSMMSSHQFYPDDVHETLSCDATAQDTKHFWHPVMHKYYETQPDYQPGQWREYNSDEFVTLRLNVGRSPICKLHLVQHIASKLVAVMKILPNRKIEDAKQELNVLTLCKECPFIMKVIDAFVNETNFYIFLEYAPFKTLDHLTQNLKGIGCESAKLYAVEIACAIDFLHTRNIIHRDIKPENMMLLGSGHVVLGDFGSSFLMQGMISANTTCGTYVTRPPEVWRRADYDFSVDIWMFGISLYNIISNKWPFVHPVLEKHIAIVEKGKLLFSIGDFTHEAESLIKRMVQVDPNERILSSEIVNHSYFDGLREPYNVPFTPEELLQIQGTHEDAELLLL